ncbi:hypothetical protein BJ742DRAFT_792881 [Cladochytrium replicatum]|nr:hypothetical protein BJ742DRAFT_792881 [Cladochytrium replicatum]
MAPMLAELKARLADVYFDELPLPTPREFDDIFLLRFLLSQPNLDKAEANVRATVRWRTKNAEILKQVRETGKPPYDDIIGKFAVMDVHKNLIDGSPMFIIRSGLANLNQLFIQVTNEQIFDWLLFQRERAFSLCDEATRRTGRIIKVVTVNDFATSVPGTAPSGNRYGSAVMDRRFLKTIGAVSKLSEVYYPQLLGLSVMLNVPSTLNAVFTIARPFLPKKTLEKMRFCKGVTFKPSNSATVASENPSQPTPESISMDPEPTDTDQPAKPETLTPPQTERRQSQSSESIPPPTHSKKTPATELRQCPFASTMLRPEDLPTFLGGSCVCPAQEGRGMGLAGCIQGVPNDQMNPVTLGSGDPVDTTPASPPQKTRFFKARLFGSRGTVAEAKESKGEGGIWIDESLNVEGGDEGDADAASVVSDAASTATASTTWGAAAGWFRRRTTSANPVTKSDPSESPLGSRSASLGPLALSSATTLPRSVPEDTIPEEARAPATLPR